MDMAMDVGASAPDSALRGPEDTSCFFLGGALTDYQISQCSSDQDRAIKTKVQGKVEDDILHMLRFVTENMVRSDNPPGSRYAIQVEKIFLNEDISSEVIKQVQTKLETEEDAKSVYQLAKATTGTPKAYKGKEQVRKELRRFFKETSQKHLILIMTGDGTQKDVSPQIRQLSQSAGQQSPSQPVMQESFCLPLRGGKYDEYTDEEFTLDLASLPIDKRLHIVINACHSGGMLNLWQFDTSEPSRRVAMFASEVSDTLRQNAIRKAGWQGSWQAEAEENYARPFLDERFLVVQKFCDNAAVGSQLKDIAGAILNDTAIPPRIRPEYKWSRPKVRDDRFLIS